MTTAPSLKGVPDSAMSCGLTITWSQRKAYLSHESYSKLSGGAIATPF